MTQKPINTGQHAYAIEYVAMENQQNMYLSSVLVLTLCVRMCVCVCVCVCVFACVGVFCFVVFCVLCSFSILSLMKLWQIDLFIVYIKDRVLMFLLNELGERDHM